MSKTTKEEIIKKATPLFLTKGYNQTSLTDIANAVGIQKPSLYSRFKSKEDIFRKMVEAYIINMQKPDKKFGSVPDIPMRDFIEHFLSRVAGCMNTYDKELAINLAAFPNRGFSFFLELGRFDPKYAIVMVKIDEEEIEMWTKVIDMAKERGEVKKDIDSKLIAKTIRHSFIGLSFSCAIGGRVSIEQLRTLIVGIYDTIKV